MKKQDSTKSHYFNFMNKFVDHASYYKLVNPQSNNVRDVHMDELCYYLGSPKQEKSFIMTRLE